MAIASGCGPWHADGRYPRLLGAGRRLACGPPVAVWHRGQSCGRVRERCQPVAEGARRSCCSGRSRRQFQHHELTGAWSRCRSLTCRGR